MGDISINLNMRHWQVNRHWLPHQTSFNQHLNKMFARTLNSNGKKFKLQNVWLIIHWWSQLVLKYQISRANQCNGCRSSKWFEQKEIWCFTLNENFKTKIYMKTHQKEEDFNTNKGKKYINYVGEILRAI